MAQDRSQPLTALLTPLSAEKLRKNSSLLIEQFRYKQLADQLFEGSEDGLILVGIENNDLPPTLFAALRWELDDNNNALPRIAAKLTTAPEQQLRLNLVQLESFLLDFKLPPGLQQKQVEGSGQALQDSNLANTLAFYCFAIVRAERPVALEELHRDLLRHKGGAALEFEVIPSARQVIDGLIAGSMLDGYLIDRHSGTVQLPSAFHVASAAEVLADYWEKYGVLRADEGTQ